MGGGTDEEASMRYQHTNTSHNQSSGFSSVAEIAGGMGLRSPQPQQLALDFAPAQVRSHGLRDAHTHPQVARRKGASFRVPASQAWGFAYLELRAGNSWPLMGFLCCWRISPSPEPRSGSNSRHSTHRFPATALLLVYSTPEVPGAASGNRGGRFSLA